MIYFFCSRCLAKKYSVAHVGNQKHCAPVLGLSAGVSAGVCDCVSDHRSNSERQWRVKEIKIPVRVVKTMAVLT